MLIYNLPLPFSHSLTPTEIEIEMFLTPTPLPLQTPHAVTLISPTLHTLRGLRPYPYT